MFVRDITALKATVTSWVGLMEVRKRKHIQLELSTNPI